MLKYEDLIEGEVYKGTDENIRKKGAVYIFRMSTKEWKSWIIVGIDKQHYFDGGSFSFCDHFESPTHEEMAHFLQCERAKKYVEYTPDIHNIFN